MGLEVARSPHSDSYAVLKKNLNLPFPLFGKPADRYPVLIHLISLSKQTAWQQRKQCK